ncbi:hypothetical protein FBU31_007408, partial [Coemansia sp. 'formosensis']
MPLGFAATPGVSASAFDIALGLGGVNNNNGAGQVATVDMPALTLLCSEDEDGRHGSCKASQSFIAGMHSQNNDFVSFLNSQSAANSQSGSSAMLSFYTSATLSDW